MHELRKSLFDREIIWTHSTNSIVVNAFKAVDRWNFTPDGSKRDAYRDEVIPLGDGYSLSQPSLLCRMVDQLRPNGKGRVLQVGTGTGYLAAVLASGCFEEVVSVEYDGQLAIEAMSRLEGLGHGIVRNDKNRGVIFIEQGDGALGSRGHAPFDAVIISAAVRDIPNAIKRQTTMWGLVVAPVGQDTSHLDLVVARKTPLGWRKNFVIRRTLRFVPLISNQHGGWTEEKLEVLKQAKKEALLARIAQAVEERNQTETEAIAQILREIGFQADDEEITRYREQILNSLGERMELSYKELKSKGL